MLLTCRERGTGPAEGLAGGHGDSLGSDVMDSGVRSLSTAQAASPPASVSRMLEWGEPCAPQLQALCKESPQKPSCH